MKRFLMLFLLTSLLLVFVLFVSGCKTLTRPKVLDPNYASYERIMIAQFAAERQPLLDLTLDPNGKVTNVQMFPQPRYIKVEQKKDSPFFRLAEVALKYLGYVGIVWQTGEAVEGVIEASTGNATYMNSYNNNSKNTGEITALTDYSDTKTDVIDTEVETSQ